MLKKQSLSLFAALLVSASAAFAGQEVYIDHSKGKDKVLVPETCFNDQEFQVDLFGAYVDGNALDHAGPLQDHGWGGGVALNYFFTRMLGVSVEGTGLYGRENRQRDDRGNGLPRAKHHVTWSAGGSLVLRFPIDSACLAPYIYVGGSYHTDGDEWASVHGGVGVEYRIVPHRVGLFTDARFTYFGDRYGNGDQNNLQARVGLRLVF